MTTTYVSSGQVSSYLQFSGGNDAVVLNGGATISSRIFGGGKELVSSGGTASRTIVFNGGEQLIFAGGVATGSLLSSGGKELVSSSGVASHTTAWGGEQIVLSGGIATSASVRGNISSSVIWIQTGIGYHGPIYLSSIQYSVTNYGVQSIHNGGITVGTTLSNGGKQAVDSGGVASNTTVSSGGSQQVGSGGVASNTTVSGGGSQQVGSGGVASNTTVSSGGSQQVGSGGVASSTTVSSGGSQQVGSGGVASSTTVSSGGSQLVGSGGVASSTTVRSGGSQQVDSGGVASNTTVSSGGSQQVGSGGVASGTTIRSLGDQWVGGTAIDAIISSGGSQSVSPGGLAGGTVISSAGFQVVSSGAVASGTTIDSGGKQLVISGGVARDTTIGGGDQNVEPGGTASGTTINSGGRQYVSSGVAFGTLVRDGGAQLVDAGAVASATVVEGNGDQIVHPGASAIGTIVSSGGRIFAVPGAEVTAAVVASGGSVISTGVLVQFADGQRPLHAFAATNLDMAGGVVDVMSGGITTATTLRADSLGGGSREIVFSGGIASGTTIGYAGKQYVASGGVAFGTTIDGLLGRQYVSSGGTASGTTISSNGAQLISAGGVASDTTISSYGVQVIFAGGVASGATIHNLGSQSVRGAANSAVVSSGGAQHVSSGGRASGTTISFGGGQHVSAAGSASGTVISSGGEQTVHSGGRAIGTRVGNGGRMTLQVGAVASGTVMNAGGAIDFDDLIFAGGSVAFDAPSGLLTVHEAQGDRAVTLAGGLTDMMFLLSTDDDGSALVTAVAPQMLSIGQTEAAKPEGTGGSTAFTFKVTRGGETTAAASAAWTVQTGTVPGTLTANAADFAGGVLPVGTVSFAPGEASRTVTVLVAGDAFGEMNESFAVALSDPSPGAKIGTGVSQGIIFNDDTSFAINTAGATVVEGNTGSTRVVFTISRAGNTAGTHAVNFAAVGTGAHPADAADFLGGLLPNGTLAFAPGQASQTLTLAIAGDATAEADETFAVTLSDATNGAAIATASASRTILSDDASFAIARTGGNKPEGTGAPSLHSFTVARTGGTSVTHSVKWAVAGAAVAGTVQANASDFIGGAFPFGTVTFAIGETSKLVTVSVAGDGAGELNEAFGVTLSGASGGATISTPAATSIIFNDDTSFAVTTAASTVVEGHSGGTPVVFTVTRAGSTSGTHAVEFAVTGSGANPAGAADLAGGVLPAGTLTFPPGATSKTITVNVAGDTSVEPDEAFTVTLSNATGGASISAPAAGRTILSDDATLSIAATSASKPEGTGGATPFIFTVTRSAGLAGTSSANWIVAGAAGSGTLPAEALDFAGGIFPAGSVSFAAGQASRTITINVAADAAAELSERFAVTLSTPSAGATLGTAIAGAVIYNDDFVSTPANQTLTGTANPDAFLLGGGLDSVFGKGGLDLFLFQPGALGAAAANATTIEDFNRALGERLDLSAIDAIAGGVDNPFSLIGTAPFSSAPGELRWEDQGTVRMIQGNVNNDTTADLTIFVKAAGPVDAGWFMM